MFLKNYTSNVPVSETIYNIEKVLIRCGVTGITKEYGPKANITAIQFHIQFQADAPPMTVRLPADEEKALDALWLDYVGTDRLADNGSQTHWSSRKRKKKSDFKQQAERTAWKIIQDWVEVQMSMIQMKQAEVREVFLPYVWNTRTQQSFFTMVKESGFKGLLPERTE